MSGIGRVLQTGRRARPDDGRDLLAVLTDGRDKSSGFDSFYLDPAGPVPPDGVVIFWTLRQAWWTPCGGVRVRAQKVGFTFDSGIVPGR